MPTGVDAASIEIAGATEIDDEDERDGAAVVSAADAPGGVPGGASKTAERRESDALFLRNNSLSDNITSTNSDAGFLSDPGCNARALLNTLPRSVSLTDMLQMEKNNGFEYERTSYQFWHNTLVELGYERSSESFMDNESSTASQAPLASFSEKSGPPRNASLSRLKPSSRLLRAASRNKDKGRRHLYDSNNDGIADGLVLFQYFDLTPNRMRELFQHWDVDSSGTITYEELLEGLRAQKLDLKEDGSTRAKVRAIFGHSHDNRNMEITISEFSTFLHRTKLAMLFHEPLRCIVYTRIKGYSTFMHDLSNSSKRPSVNGIKGRSGKVYRPSAELLVIDYSKNNLGIHCLNPNSEDEPLPFTLDHEQARHYFFGSRKINSSMRWVSVERPDPISIITIAVKYRLHPLALEDMLSLSMQRPKVDKYGSHYFLVLPAFRLTDHAYNIIRNFDMKNENLCDQWKGKALVEKQNFALCVAGTNKFDPASSYDTVISVEGGFAPFGMIIKNSAEYYEGSMHMFTDSAAQGDSNDTDTRSSGMFRSALFRQLGTDFSRLRMQRSIFMMYSLIDSAVQQLGPVIDMYRMRLDWYTHMIRTKKWRFGNRIRGLLDTKRELEKLSEQIRPCISVIRHLINDEGLAPTASTIAAMRAGHASGSNPLSSSGSSSNMSKMDQKDHEKKMDQKDHEKRRSGARGLRTTTSVTIPQKRSPLWDETLHRLHTSGRIGFHSVYGSGGAHGGGEKGESSSNSDDASGDGLFGLAEIKQYFEDIDDALSMYLEDLRHMVDSCASYTTEFESYGDRRMNDILFVLTIVTTLFVPAQFFTGLFGMNFVKSDGTPNMPMLSWQYGYLFFWIISLTLTILTLLGLFIQGWLPCGRCNKCADRLCSKDDVDSN
eukprot:g335.t1